MPHERFPPIRHVVFCDRNCNQTQFICVIRSILWWEIICIFNENRVILGPSDWIYQHIIRKTVELAKLNFILILKLLLSLEFPYAKTLLINHFECPSDANTTETRTFISKVMNFHTHTHTRTQIAPDLQAYTHHRSPPPTTGTGLGSTGIPIQEKPP